MKKAEELAIKANIVTVETGGLVATTLLDVIRFFNATGAGAYINGCDQVNFGQFIKEIPLEFDIDSKRKEFKVKMDLLYRGE